MQSESLADPRSDVYGLAVVLCEVLFGDTPPKRRSADWLAAAARAATTGFRDLDPGVAASLTSAVGRALEVEPARRTPTALEFANAVHGGLRDSATAVVASPLEGTTGGASGRRSPWRIAPSLAAAFLAGAAVMDMVAPRTVGGFSQVRSAWERMSAATTESSYREEREELLRALDRANVPRESPEFQLWLARTAWSQGDLSGAERAFAGVAASPRAGAEEKAWHGLAAFFLAERRHVPELARKWWEAARSSFQGAAGGGEAPASRFARAMLLLLDGRLKSAREELEALVHTAPDPTPAGIALGWLALRQGRPDAGTAIESAARGRPYDPFVRLVQALARLNSPVGSEGPRGRDEALALARLWPDSVEARILEGRIQLGRGESVAALAAAERALELDPLAYDAHRLRVRVLERMNDPYRLVAALTRLIEIDPVEDAHLVMRARAYLAARDRDRATADLRSYLERAPKGKYADQARALLEE
jgi:tetratricopeptide (TPR) repeat protein